MSVFGAVVTGLLMGLVFGLALEKSRVFEPGMMIGQFQLRNWIMLKVFLTAVATGLVVLAALNGFGVVKLAPKATLYGADIIGGMILGAGIAIAGACPGTVAAQIGAGYKDSIAVLAGGLLGAFAFAAFEADLRPILLSGGPGRLTLDVMIGQPYWLVALIAAAVLVVALYLLERWRPWTDDIGRNGDGLTGDAGTSEPIAAPRPQAAE